jgi:hypothetical protein
MGIERVVVAPFERRWTEDNDGVWHLGYYDGADLVTQSALCVELVTLYEGTQIQHSGWYATSDPLTEEGFFGPRFATPDNAKMLVEAFDNALSRLDPATSGGPVAVAGPGVLLMRSMVEDASGSVEEARRWNKDQRLCVACGAELAADTCQNMVCPVGLAFVATNSPEDLEDL